MDLQAFCKMLNECGGSSLVLKDIKIVKAARKVPPFGSSYHPNRVTGFICVEEGATKTEYEFEAKSLDVGAKLIEGV